MQVLRASKYLGRGDCAAFSMGGLAAAHYIKNYKKSIKAELVSAERALLRKYYYKQRTETWELFPDKIRAEDLISIDFNHQYLRLQKEVLPIKRINAKEVKITEELPWGFYFLEFYQPKDMEPSLPTLQEQTTFYKTGWGRGLY
jgi:hypothetical protein